MKVAAKDGGFVEIRIINYNKLGKGHVRGTQLPISGEFIFSTADGNGILYFFAVRYLSIPIFISVPISSFRMSETRDPDEAHLGSLFVLPPI